MSECSKMLLLIGSSVAAAGALTLLIVCRMLVLGDRKYLDEQAEHQAFVEAMKRQSGHTRRASDGGDERG